MKKYSIGRGRTGKEGIHHIQIARDDKSVSRYHAEILRTDDSRLFLTDCSRNGTYILANGQWTSIREGYVQSDTPLQLGGSFVTNLGVILDNARDEGGHTNSAEEVGTQDSAKRADRSFDDRPSRFVERDPETGEIIKRSNS